MSGSLREQDASLWTATAEVERRPPLDADVRVDVAVVGAGITGLAAALELQRAGVSVVVLEQSVIGAGATGHTTGKLSALHGLAYRRMTALHGLETAAAYAHINEQGLERAFALTGEHDIECDLRRQANFTYAMTVGERELVAEEVDAARAAGLGAELVEEVGLPWPAAGAVRVERQAELHAQKLLGGLARTLESAGGRIFEFTRARSVSHGAPCVIATARATVTADHVILATHMPFPHRGAFFARMRPERSYALAVRVAEDVPSGMFINAGSPTRSIRAHRVNGEDLLLVGGEGHKVGQGGPTSERYRTLEAFARAHWTVESVEHRWSAQDNVPLDGLPLIGRIASRSPRVLVATGYRKWGLALAIGAAGLLRDRVIGVSRPDAEPFDPVRRPPLRSLDAFVKETFDVGTRFVAGRIATPAPAAPLSPGEGRVVGHGSRRIAVSRDENGVVRALSARCTHLGCIVAYNDAEQSWDCPCHGSRFALDGTVLEGPTVRPLFAAPTPPTLAKAGL